MKIKTTDKNRYVDIEEADEKLGVMVLYYWADAYSRQIKRGDRFGKLEKTISIAIIDHELEELRGMEEIGVKWQIRDEQSSIEYAQDEGFKQGKAIGRTEGRIEGRTEGKREQKEEIAKNMLKKQMKIQDIADITGLNPEEIKALK